MSSIELKSLPVEDQQKVKTLQDRKEKKKNRAKFFFVMSFVVLIVINVVDEVVTQMSGTVQSSVINEFFVEGQGLTYNGGVAKYANLLTVTSLIGFIAPFYKSLADKFGRKPFIILNVLVMGIGMFLIYLSPSFIIYAIGLVLLQFMLGHDIQIVYVQEAAPADKRGRVYSTIKALGVGGLFLVPILRQIFMGDDPTKWRLIFLLPAIIALVVTVLSYFFIDETDAYLDGQINNITTKGTETNEQEKIGVISGFKYIFKNKELRWTIISFSLYYLPVIAMFGYYQSIMYQGGMGVEAITQALIMYPIIYFVLTFISGYIADLMGRKKLIIMSIVGAVIFYVLFNYSINTGWNAYVIGGFYGLYLGNYWIGGDYLMMMGGEKAPTKLRVTIMGNFNLASKFASLAGNLILTALLGHMSVGNAALLVAIPSTVVAGIIIICFLSETKGVDLTKVGKE